MWAFNLFGIVETLLVGKFGESALAASGIVNFIVYLGCAISIGIGIGVQTETSHRFGKNESNLALPLNAGILISIISTLVFTLLIWKISPVLLRLFSADPSVISLATPFLKYKLVGLWAYSLVFIFRGHWMGIQKPAPAFSFLLLTNGLAVVIDLVLMFGWFGVPKQGFVGAGIGFSIAAVVGASAFGIWSWIDRKESAFLSRLPTQNDVQNILKFGTPAGIQEVVIAIGLTILVLVFGRIGTLEQAVGNVLIQLSTLLILPGIGFGLTAHTLVGEAFGKGNHDEVQNWSRRVAISAFAFTVTLSALLIAFCKPILAQFLGNPAAQQMAQLPFIIDLVTITLFSMGTVYEYALKGLGRMMLSLSISTVLYVLIIGPTFLLIWLNIELTILRMWILFSLFNVAYFVAYVIAFYQLGIKPKVLN